MSTPDTLSRDHSAFWLSDAHFWAAIYAAEEHGFYPLLGPKDGGDWFNTWMCGGEL